MIEIVALILVGAALAGVFVMHEFERRAWTRERADLLNRLMVKHWNEYQALQPTTEGPPVRQVITEADEAKWWEEQRSKAEKEHPGMTDEVRRDFDEAQAAYN